MQLKNRWVLTASLIAVLGLGLSAQAISITESGSTLTTDFGATVTTTLLPLGGETYLLTLPKGWLFNPTDWAKTFLLGEPAGNKENYLTFGINTLLWTSDQLAISTAQSSEVISAAVVDASGVKHDLTVSDVAVPEAASTALLLAIAAGGLFILARRPNVEPIRIRQSLNTAP